MPIYHLIDINSQEDFIECLNNPEPFTKIVTCHLEFHNYTFDMEVNCENFLFKKSVNFGKSTFHKKVNFNNSIFEGDVSFGGFNIDKQPITAKNTEFKNTSDFTDCQFKKTASFSYCNFEKVRFNDSTFDGTTYFSYSIFKNTTSFFRLRFLEFVHFQGSKFLDNVDYSYSVFFKKATFNSSESKVRANFWGVIFHELADFTRTKFTDQAGNAKCRFENTVFNHSVLFFESQFDDLRFSNSVIRAQGYFLNTKIQKADRETYRVIKDQFLKQNNKIDALTFFKLEMVENDKELKEQWKNEKWRKKPLSDLVINFLNKISNNYGQNWIQGVIFTIIVGLAFFLLSLLFLEAFPFEFGFGNTVEGFRYSLQYFFQFLLPTHKFNYLIQYEPTTGFYFFDLFGRIMVSYGIYQVVSAFRKYNR